MLSHLIQNSAEISIIVPVLNEAHTIGHVLDYYVNLQKTSELIFVDGNSKDKTAQILSRHGFNVIATEFASRGAQLYQGALHASKEILLFHHFDSRLSNHFIELIQQALRTCDWGRFDVTLDSNDRWLRWVEQAMNLRSRITGIATGDQAIFVRKNTLLACAKELKEYPLMEDIYLSSQLKKNSRPACLHARVTSSARYWQNNGVIVSILKMWALRLLYFFGMPPQKLYRIYYGKQARRA